MNRRTLLKKATAAGVGLVAAPVVNRRAFRLFAESTQKYSSHAIDLVQRSIVIDMQNPFSENWSGVLEPIAKPANDQWFYDPRLFKLEDFEKFKQSGLTVIHTGTAFPLHNPYEVALKYFASWNGFIAHNSDWLMRI